MDTRNSEPVFDDQDDDTKGVQNEVTTRKVAENTKAVAADDVADVDRRAWLTTWARRLRPKTPTPTRMLWCTRWKALMRLGSLSTGPRGQIEVGAGTKLDYETKDTYMVTVRVTDSFGDSDTIAVTITVTDMDEAPKVTGDATADYPENGDWAGGDVHGGGPGGDRGQVVFVGR